MVIADQHAGLTLRSADVSKVQPTSDRVHFVRNLLARIPKAHQDMVAALFRTVFAGIDEITVHSQGDHVRATLAERWPKHLS